jgi:adenylylsulfate kinase
MQQKGCAIWITGLSGAGKSTLALGVKDALRAMGINTCVLDGDVIRRGLCSDLSFSATDRTENLRRVGEVTALMVDAGLVVIAALISPFNDDRALVRRRVGEGRFIEVYCDCPLAVCEDRDIKGLYKKARRGELKDFTGISSPYEIPTAPEVIVDPVNRPVADGVAQVIAAFSGRRHSPDVQCAARLGTKTG